MEDNALQTINIQQFHSLLPESDTVVVDADFLVGEFKGVHILQEPVRFDGFLILFLQSGSLTLEINLNQYEVGERSVVLLVPGNIIRISGIDSQADFLLSAVSRQWMGNIRMDFNNLFQESIRLWNNPCIVIPEDLMGIVEQYYNLAGGILRTLSRSKREPLGPLLTSFLYFVLDIWTRELSAVSKSKTNAPSNRLSQVFEQFIALVTEYHCQERGVAFYGEKMGLTPKYLSKLVRQASGRSAPEWIDAFVILEAKNLLRYSNKTIKEIVYALNYPNQSVFYKFFKAHTGQTPSQFRKG